MPRNFVAVVVTLLTLFSVALPPSVRAQVEGPSNTDVIFLKAVPTSSSTTLTWTAPGATSTGTYTIVRTDPSTITHTFTVAPGYVVSDTSPGQYVDTGTVAGSTYDYTISGPGGTGHLYSGYEVPALKTIPTGNVAQRGTVDIISDKTMDGSDGTNPAMVARIQRLKADLIADGWNVIYDANHSVARDPGLNASGVPADIPPALPGDSVKAVKHLIHTDYLAYPDIKAIILIGHVSVPYSGDQNPDGHPNHLGAWPADVYYGDGQDDENHVSSATTGWTDTTVDDTGAADVRNFNVPGDGKFDQSNPPQPIIFGVGRIDMSSMGSFTETEQQLIATYLDKDHGYRTDAIRALSEGRLSDNFHYAAADGWREMGAILGGDAVSINDSFYLNNGSGSAAGTGAYYDVLQDAEYGSYTWLYGDGPGGSTSAGGVGSSVDFQTYNPHAFFYMLFGDYFGDYMYPNDFLRAAIATPTYGLTAFWSNRPEWTMYHTGLGDALYNDEVLSQNTNTGWDNITMGFMGDPTLRTLTVEPPTGATAVIDATSAPAVDIAWTEAIDPNVSTYYIYRATSASGPFTFLADTGSVTSTFQDTTAVTGTPYYYLVRSVELLNVNSGSYYEQSEGALAPYAPSYTPPAINLVAPYAVGTAYTHDTGTTPGGAVVYAPFSPEVLATAVAGSGHYLTNVSLYVNGKLLQSFANPQTAPGTTNLAEVIPNGPLFSYPRFNATVGTPDLALVQLTAGKYTFSATATDDTGTVVTSNSENLYIIDGGPNAYEGTEGNYLLGSIYTDSLSTGFPSTGIDSFQLVPLPTYNRNEGAPIEGNNASINLAASGTYTNVGGTVTYYAEHNPNDTASSSSQTYPATGSSISVTAGERPGTTSAQNSDSQLVLLQPEQDTSYTWPSTLTMYLGGGITGGQSLSITAPMTGPASTTQQVMLSPNTWTKVQFNIPGFDFNSAGGGMNFDGIKIVENTSSGAYSGTTGPTWYVDDIGFVATNYIHGETNPTVDMHLPVSGQVIDYTPNKIVQISADVAERDGKIQHVDFVDYTNVTDPSTGMIGPHYVEIGSSDSSATSVTGSTYTYNWTIPGPLLSEPQTHTIYVIGTSSLGTQTVSGAVTITIQPIGNLVFNFVDASNNNAAITAPVTVSATTSPITDKGTLTDLNADIETTSSRTWDNVGALLSYDYIVDGTASAYGDVNAREPVDGSTVSLLPNVTNTVTIPLYEYSDLKLAVQKQLTPVSTPVAVTAADQISVSLTDPTPVALTATPAAVTVPDSGIADFTSVAPVTTYTVNMAGLLGNWIGQVTPPITELTTAWGTTSTDTVTLYPATTVTVEVVDTTPAHNLVTLSAPVDIVLNNQTWAGNSSTITVTDTGESAATLIQTGTFTIDTSELVAASYEVVSVTPSPIALSQGGSTVIQIQVTLAPPADLVATAGDTTVGLTWVASGGATSYNVYRSTTSGGEGNTPIATGVTGTSYSDTGLTDGTTYYYEVTAVAGTDESAPSNEASATPHIPVPVAPTGLTATAANAQVTLSWTASATATSYNVYRGTTSGGESVTPVATDVTATTYTDTALTNGTTYYYYVTGVNVGGEGLESNEASATPLAAPPAPADLIATAGDTIVTLAWNASSTAATYNVYRSTTSGGEAGSLLVSGLLTPGYTDTGLTDGTTYYYEVTAVNIGGESLVSNEASATPEPPAPAAPTGLTATPGNATVTLAWTGSVGATSYDVFRGTSAGGESGTPVATGIVTGTYVDNTVTNGITYYYTVEAVNGGGPSPASNEASATPLAPPIAPANLIATAGHNQDVLSWTASPTAATYNLYRSITAGGEGSTPVLTGITTNGYTDIGLTNGTTYYYQVTAVNIGGESPKSNEASATPEPPVPAAPTSLTATPGNATVALAWSASLTATSYSVFRGTTAGGESTTAIATGITSGTYADNTVTNGTTYYYTVEAVNGGGPSPASNEASATPLAAPAAPANLTATAGNTQNVLSWSASATAATYNLYRSTTAGGEGATPVLTGLTATGYTDTGLTNGTTYYYEVTAVNIGGESAKSNEASATPLPPAPSAPTSLEAAEHPTSVVLTWVAGTGAASYSIYRGTTAGGESSTPIAIDVTTLTYTDSALTNGTTYYYYVTSVNLGGASTASNEASATPQVLVPLAPGGLTVKAGVSSAILSWTASTNAVTYNVYRGTTSGGESTTAIATGITGTTYTDSGLTNGTTYYYTVTAVDVTGTSPASNEASTTPEPAPSYPAGLTFFSSPYDYAGVSLDTLFGYSNVKLAVWSPDDSEYFVTPTWRAGAVDLGIGYWARFPTAVTLTSLGTPAPTNVPFTISLSAGWNMVGDPFTTPVPLTGLSFGTSEIPFAQASTGLDPLIDSSVYGYSASANSGKGAYVLTSTLQPLSGYWVFASEATTMVVPAP